MIGFAELEPFLDRKRHELLHALNEFSLEEVRTLRETADGWTPCEVVEHLVKVENEVARQVQRLLASVPSLPAEPADEKLVDITELFRERGLLGTKKKTLPALEPSGFLSYDRGLQQLADARKQLKSLLPQLASRETNSLLAPHPLGITLNACQWVLFSAFHEWSHIHQLKRIRSARA
jgi:hypothetical protein